MVGINNFLLYAVHFSEVCLSFIWQKHIHKIVHDLSLGNNKPLKALLVLRIDILSTLTL